MHAHCYLIVSLYTFACVLYSHQCLTSIIPIKHKKEAKQVAIMSASHYIPQDIYNNIILCIIIIPSVSQLNHLHQTKKGSKTGIYLFINSFYIPISLHSPIRFSAHPSSSNKEGDQNRLADIVVQC